jgi:pseudouridine synthase
MKPPRPVPGWNTPGKDRRPRRRDHDADAAAEATAPESIHDDALDDAEDDRDHGLAGPLDRDGDDDLDAPADDADHHPEPQPESRRPDRPRPRHDDDDHDEPPAGPGRPERLQKVLARAGIGSRRACEELIEEGEVQVNGTVVDRLPVFVDVTRDRITVRDRHLRFREKHVYVMLFKPRGVLSTNEIQPDRRRAIDLVHHSSKARLFPVGRLDVDSSGLLLLTSDGELANRLTHPRYGIHKCYEVTVEGRLESSDLARLERGVFLQDKHSTHGRKAGRRTSRSKLKIIKSARDRTRLLMELHEGRNRQIRRMMLYVGHKVRKLRRVSLGPLKLRGLKVGEWRDLTPAEVKALRRAADIGEKAWRKERAQAAAEGGARTGGGRARRKRPGGGGRGWPGQA